MHGKRLLRFARNDVVTNPRCPNLVWSDLAARPQYGTSQKAHATPNGVPILRMGNVQNGTLSYSDRKYVELSAKDLKTFQLNHGDILINRTNSAELVGKAGLFNRDGDFVFASYLVRLVVDPAKAVPEYICRYINSRRGREYVERHRTRAIGQANINARKIALMPVLLPSLEMQQSLMACLHEAETKVNSLRRMQEKSARDIAALMPVVLADAFRGEL
ncbi:MAG: restriction endonuclease subunit S [Nitrospinae bacterium]|nr:restriction endonuclease subunit S [Nitrospinota bacterium]